ncbi:hypothetical protein BGZ95_005721 [Linnemannia exigua]|uniref:SET domain-containing protein n=1 Tax=Linnemannia exigua TaxID=604196 RepID=A0AAD4D1L9_9FUNG|nr:hypothetical protein BGZ95_005721 [Linnemannia exigua]
MKNSTVVVAATVGVLAVAAVGYAVYFDSKRQTDPEFKRKLKRDRKRAEKLAKAEAKRLTEKSTQDIEEFLATATEEDYPTSMEEREQFCMAQLSAGEELFVKGPENYSLAAICFYRALKVYPAPAELVMVFQKTIPPEVFTIVMGMLSKDVQSKEEKYYTVFPPKEMNVKVEEKPEGMDVNGQRVMRRGLVATKGFTKGEVIFTEAPVISSLEPSLEGKNFCHYCLKEMISKDLMIPCNSCSVVVFCSDECRTKAGQEFHEILCTKNLLATSTGASATPSPAQALREYTKDSRNVVPGLLAKFLAKMVHDESLNSGAEYNSFDHLERLVYVEKTLGPDEEKEIELLKLALGANIPGIDQFITEERYLVMKARLLYNIYGISSAISPSLNVKPMPETHRSVRDRPITGAGLYRTTSYLMHSCEPNTKIVYSGRDHTVSLIATETIKAGDELQIGYIKNGKQSTEQRRLELFTKYRLQCSCALCEMTD